MFSFAASLFDGLAEYFDVWRYAELDEDEEGMQTRHETEDRQLRDKHDLERSQLEERRSQQQDRLHGGRRRLA